MDYIQVNIAVLYVVIFFMVATVLIYRFISEERVRYRLSVIKDEWECREVHER